MPKKTKKTDDVSAAAAKRPRSVARAKAGERGAAPPAKSRAARVPKPAAGAEAPAKTPRRAPVVRRRSTAKGTAAQPVSAPPAAPSHEDIARRAYELYLAREGRNGSASDDWARAEAELRAALDRARSS